MAHQFVNRCGDKSDYVRGAFEGLELGGVDPIAGKVGVVVNAQPVRENDVLEAAGLSDVFILESIELLMEDLTVGTYIREIGGFEDDATAHGERSKNQRISLLWRNN